MHNFKVGDKVFVRRKMGVHEAGILSQLPEELEVLGKIVKIEFVTFGLTNTNLFTIKVDYPRIGDYIQSVNPKEIYLAA